MSGDHRFRRFSHAIVSCILFAAEADVAISTPVNGPNITEQRNATTGFAITLWPANVDALGDDCSRLGSSSDGQILSALKTWQDRNATYVNAALEYMMDIEDFISAEQGEEAQRNFHAERKAEFVASTRKIEAVWFPGGKIDEASCMHMANRTADGSMDLDRNAEFFPILQMLKAEVDKKEAR